MNSNSNSISLLSYPPLSPSLSHSLTLSLSLFLSLSISLFQIHTLTSCSRIPLYLFIPYFPPPLSFPLKTALFAFFQYKFISLQCLILFPNLGNISTWPKTFPIHPGNSSSRPFLCQENVIIVPAIALTFDRPRCVHPENLIISLVGREHGTTFRNQCAPLHDYAMSEWENGCDH